MTDIEIYIGDYCYNPPDNLYNYDDDPNMKVLAIVDSFHDFFSGGRVRWAEETERRVLCRFRRNYKQYRDNWSGCNTALGLDNIGCYDFLFNGLTKRLDGRDAKDSVFWELNNNIESTNLYNLESKVLDNIRSVFPEAQNMNDDFVLAFRKPVYVGLHNWNNNNYNVLDSLVNDLGNYNEDYLASVYENIEIYPSYYIVDQGSRGNSGYFNGLTVINNRQYFDAANETNTYNIGNTDSDTLQLFDDDGDDVGWWIPQINENEGYTVLDCSWWYSDGYIYGSNGNYSIRIQTPEVAAITEYIENELLDEGWDFESESILIFLILGAKRFGDWIQAHIAKRYYFTLFTQDRYCAIHAMYLGTCVIIDNDIYNYNLYKNCKGSNSGLLLDDDGDLYDVDSNYIDLGGETTYPADRRYIQKYQKYKKKYLELKKKLKNNTV